MRSRPSVILFCLFFSGLAALVYQVIWTRLLGFAFGTTTEAIGTVLAIFFGGMALGNALAAKRLERIDRPIRVYGLLEVGIGAFALLSLPVLWRLESLYAWAGSEHGAFGSVLLRLVAASLVLLPPTIAMGATLPVIARGLVASDESLGRWSAYLYTTNTLGAVAGAYLCGFWMIPSLGLNGSVLLAGAVNIGVAGAVFFLSGTWQTPWRDRDPRDEAAGLDPNRKIYLAVFAVSGFVAIGYEIVWAKTFSLIMEGTLYGFSSVLATYLLGIALGSLAVARFVDRIEDLPRLFAGLHLAIGAFVALGIALVPSLPYFLQKMARLGGSADVVHLFFLVIIPIVLIPTALFGAAFPVLIRLYTQSAAAVGRGMGIATAVNTAGSIAASLLVGFWWIPTLGIDATLYVLLLVDCLAALFVVLRFQRASGRARIAGIASAVLVLAFISVSYNGVRVGHALTGRWVKATHYDAYQTETEERMRNTRRLIEGRHAIVTIHDEHWGRRISTNSMPESSRAFTKPHMSIGVTLLGVLPYFFAEQPERGLVIGFGGGGTVEALVRTGVREIEVVELEEKVIEAAKDLYPLGDWPLDDPRVALRINDGRHHLVLGRHGGGQGYDIIASQPSHPWLAGAANLFTEDFFRLVRDNLNEGGVFGLWLNGFRIDRDSALAVMTSFSRVFPGALVAATESADTPRMSLALLGGTQPLVWHPERIRARFDEPAIADILGQHGVSGPDELLARIEGRLEDFAAIDPTLANTDNNAQIETRIPRMKEWRSLDFPALEAELAKGAAGLPPIEGSFDLEAVIETLLRSGHTARGWELGARLGRVLDQHGESLDPYTRSLASARAALQTSDAQAQGVAVLEALVRGHPDRDEAARALGDFFASKNEARRAAAAFEEAYRRSGDVADAASAAIAWSGLDAAATIAWAEKVPESAEESRGRLAMIRAEHALSQGSPRAELKDRYLALERYRASAEGRKVSGIHALLGALASELGDRHSARAYRDADFRERSERAGRHKHQARAALAKGDLDGASKAIRHARELEPIETSALEIQAEIAKRRGDRDGLRRTLGEIQRWAPGVRSGKNSVARILLGADRSERGPDAESKPVVDTP